MHPSPLFGPIIALVAWSIVMFFWLAIARRPYVQGRLPDGTRGTDIEREHPGKLNWPAHNYQNLMEQPTLFYAVVLVLALLPPRPNVAVSISLAWCYVALRIAHSVLQATVNTVRVRFLLFMAATLCLMGLAMQAAMSFLQA